VILFIEQILALVKKLGNSGDLLVGGVKEADNMTPGNDEQVAGIHRMSV
jgi:hypothetical protein